MARGVEKYAVSVWGRLRSRPSRPEPNCLHLGPVQVIYREVDVHLLGYGIVRPCRWPVIGHSKRRQPASLRSHGDELVTGQGDFAAHKRGPELSQCSRIAAVERYRCQAGNSHVAYLNRCAGPPIESGFPTGRVPS